MAASFVIAVVHFVVKLLRRNSQSLGHPAQGGQAALDSAFVLAGFVDCLLGNTRFIHHFLKAFPLLLHQLFDIAGKYSASFRSIFLDTLLVQKNAAGWTPPEKAYTISYQKVGLFSKECNMLVVPYLVLFFIALGLQIVFYTKKDIRLCTAGHIAGAVCGLYITFLILLYAGFGKNSSYAAFVVIKGFPMYIGRWSILPAAMFALILVPLLCWAPRWVAYMLTHFIDDGAATILPETQILTGFARAFSTLAIVIMYFIIGFIPLFLMFDAAQYSHSVIAYLNNNYILLSFGGLILAIWALVGIRCAVNIVIAKLYANGKG